MRKPEPTDIRPALPAKTQGILRSVQSLYRSQGLALATAPANVRLRGK